MFRRPLSALLTAVAVATLAVPLPHANAGTTTYKAVWSGGLAETSCDGLPVGECSHSADSSEPFAVRPTNVCVEAVVAAGQESPLPWPGAGLQCVVTLSGSSYGVKEARGACIGAPRGIAPNGAVTVTSVYLPSSITVPVRITNKNGSAVVTGTAITPFGTASVVARFTAACATADPKRGEWSGTFTFEQPI